MKNIVKTPDANIFQNYYVTLSQKIPEILYKIFGLKNSREFYVKSFTDLGHFTGRIVDLDYYSEQQLNSFELDQHYPTSHFESWDKFREVCKAYNGSVIDILYCVVNLDERLAIALLFCFGIFPQYKNNIEFFDALGIHNEFLNTCIPEAIDNLIILLDSLVEVSADKKIDEIRTFLNDFLFYNPNRLIKFVNGNLITFDSNLYNFAKLMLSKTYVDSSTFSVTQLQIWQYYYEFFYINMTFPIFKTAKRVLGISAESIKYNIGEIIEISSKGTNINPNFVKSTNGRIFEVKQETITQQILGLYNLNPKIINSPNLSATQQVCIQAVIDNSESKNSLGKIGQTVGFSSAEIRRHLIAAISKLKEVNSYFDKEGNKLKATDIRVQLIQKSSEINKLKIKQVNLKLIALITETYPDSRTFKYTYQEVAEFIGIKTKDPALSIYNMCKGILTGKDDFDLTLVDQTNTALTKKHLRVVELLLKYGLLVFAEQNKLHAVAEALMFTDQAGRYLIYIDIGIKIGLSETSVVGYVDRIIDFLENLEA